MKTFFTTLFALLFMAPIIHASGDPDYCFAYGKSDYYGWIAGVRMCNVYNHSGFSYDGYGDYMHQTIQVEAGKKYPITLTPRTWPAFHEDARWTVWIDFDHNGKFDDDEVVVHDSYSREITAWVVIPSDAKDGDTRMRVGMRFIYDPVPCGYYWYGEVEDYSVHIKNPYYGYGNHDYCHMWGKKSNYGYIKQVKICEINKVTGCDPSGYADYTKWMCKLTQNKSHEIYLKPYLRKQYNWRGDWYMEKPRWMVWIDYNQNFKFDKEELVCDSACYDPLKMHINVPSWAKPGKSRMRVAMNFKDHHDKPDPCDYFWYGEVEDYSVWIEHGPPAPKYCESGAQDPNYGYIYQVWFGDIDNYSDYSHNGYADYTQKSTVMYRNDKGTLMLKPSLNWVHDHYYGWIKPSAYWNVWIDFNQNGKFDNNEKVAFHHSDSWVWSYVYIPSWAKTGKTRMRVAMGFDDYPEACGTYWYGEVEDYTVDIRDHYDPLVAPPVTEMTELNPGENIRNRDVYEIGIAPNPASSSIRLELPGTGQGLLSIMNVSGTTVANKSIAAGSHQESIDQLQTGTYFVRWIDGQGQVYVKRFIKN
ncbi:MAG: GEVED domain-containing protein [Saprospiraceae bacterium]